VLSPFVGHSGFFDTTLTRRILGWRPSTDPS
jgi:hypothetical protein